MSTTTIQWYYFHEELIWPDGPFKSEITFMKYMRINKNKKITMPYRDFSIYASKKYILRH
jgi:hypothetical protein